MVEGVQQGPVLIGTFFMVAEDYLPPTAAPGTSGPHEPCPRTPRVQIVESVESTPDLEAREERRCSGRRALVGHGLDMEDLASMCERQCRKACNLRSAIGPLSLRSRRGWPDRPQGRTRPQNPACSMTPRRWRGLREPERRLWLGTRSQSGITWATHPWRRSPRRQEPWDAPDQVESTLSATASTYPSSSASTQRWGWTPSCSTSTAWTTRRTA